MVGNGRPPVTEVVVSVAFDPQPCLVGPQLLITLSNIAARYSRIEEQPPYEMPQELPVERQLLRPPAPPFRIIGAPGVAMDHRYWLKDPMDDSIVIQVQSNYLAVNWRKTKSSTSYLGFDVLFAKFTEVFEEVQAAVIGKGGVELAVQGAELSYINLVRPGEFWSDHRDLKKMLALEAPILDNFEQLNLTYAKALSGESGEFVGRLQTAVQTGFAPTQEDMPISQVVYSNLTPVVNITTVVRSAPLDPSGLNAARSFFYFAHEEAGASFRSITSSEARDFWGV